MHSFMQRRSLRRVLAVAAMAVAVGGAVSAAGAQAAGAATLNMRLTVNDTEDGGLTNFDKYDEVSLRYAGQQLQRSMAIGDSWQLPSVAFNGGTYVDVWELDTGNWLNPHDHIGSFWATPTCKDETQVLEIPGARYTVAWNAC